MTDSKNVFDQRINLKYMKMLEKLPQLKEMNMQLVVC